MRAVHIIALALLVLTAGACENGPPWARDGEDPSDQATPDYGPTAAYNRRFIFLGPGADLPTAAIFDFVALSDSIGIRRGLRARVVNGLGWRTLDDAGWEMGPMREPWRIVPHEPFTLTVSENGDLVALIHRDSVTTRLILGATIAEHSPDVSTQLVLRSARLAVGDQSVAGILLDSQLGRAVNPRLVRRDLDDRAARSDSTAATDSAAVSPTPIARPGAEALLLNNGGFYVVLATGADGPFGWIRDAGRDDVRAGARLEPTEWTTDEDTGVQTPSAWRIVSSDGEMSGELTTESTDPVVLGGVGELETLSYELVSGWVEDRSVRRDVFGLVRHVR
jgi:hypothetical protein